MARKTTEKDILRFIELKERKAELESEIAELRDLFIDDMEYAIPDDEKENVVNIVVGKSKVSIATVIKPFFDKKTFAKEHPKLVAQYTTDKPEDRVTATTDR